MNLLIPLLYNKKNTHIVISPYKHPFPPNPPKKAKELIIMSQNITKNSRHKRKLKYIVIIKIKLKRNHH